ncbi:unnamed protein product, partial [Brassica oleracea var. botrytis]
MSFSLVYLVLQVFHHMVLIFHSFKDAGFSDLDLDMQVFQIWKTSGLEDFQTTSRKSSRQLPESLLTESSPMSPFHNRSERFSFNQMVLIFHLDMYFVCSIKICLSNF